VVALWLLAVPAGGALALTVFNLLTWPRGRRVDASVRSRALGQVSVLIPARNEVLNIEACVRAVAACGPVAPPPESFPWLPPSARPA
jgi:cellulose synthase/poly-beta-1,6-N-acetylglucosamine synthase-like glycosyltransferase